MQGCSAPEQPGFEYLAGELADTVRALELVAGVLLRQVHASGEELLHDDGTDRTERLITVAACLADLHCALGRADRVAGVLWSEVAHLEDEAS